MNNRYLHIFEEHGLNFARCFGSKSTYHDNHPDHLIIFNARIYTKEYYMKERDYAIKDFFRGMEEEIWYGDLDLNKDIFNLYKVYLDIKQPFIITYEDSRKVIEIGR